MAVGKKDDYYIMKNSWSEKWGENGYVRIAKGEGRGTCGIVNQFDVYPIV